MHKNDFETKKWSQLKEASTRIDSAQVTPVTFLWLVGGGGGVA